MKNPDSYIKTLAEKSISQFTNDDKEFLMSMSISEYNEYSHWKSLSSGYGAFNKKVKAEYEI